MDIKHYRHNGTILIGEAGASSEDTVSALGLNDEYVRKGYYEIDSGVGESLNVKLNEKGVAEKRLGDTDWRVTRHRDEKELGSETTITEDEYVVLLEKRKNWRVLLSEA